MAYKVPTYLPTYIMAIPTASIPTSKTPPTSPLGTPETLTKCETFDRTNPLLGPFASFSSSYMQRVYFSDTLSVFESDRVFNPADQLTYYIVPPFLSSVD